MNVLLATVDGRSATARTVRWSGVALLPAVGLGAVVLTELAELGGLSGARQSGPGLVGETALALAAVSLAFAADDPSSAAAPATPVGMRARLLARLAAVAPVVAVVWIATLVAADVPWRQELVERAVAAVGLGLAATAAAVVLGRRSPLTSSGATGAATTLAAVGVARIGAPAALLDVLPPAAVCWSITAAGALLALAVATTEPPSR